MKTRVLTHADVRRLLTMDRALPAVEAAFAAHGRGEAQMPPKVYLSLPQHAGDFRAMPAYLDGVAGVKWVNSHPENPTRFGIPSVIGTYLLSDPDTALPLAVMDATWLTAMRTGAAAGVATRHLARGAPRTVGFVGCGVQARTVLAALRALYEGFEVLAADVDLDAAQDFAADAGGRAVDVEEAAGCEVVCTATPVRSPVVNAGWVRRGAHLNALGADAPGKQEIESRLLEVAKIVVDDLEQARHSGEINVPLRQGDITVDRIHATLGEVIVGQAPGREGDEVTLFDSTGLAIQDAALARVVYERACEDGAGIEVELVPYSPRVE